MSALKLAKIMKPQYRNRTQSNIFKRKKTYPCSANPPSQMSQCPPHSQTSSAAILPPRCSCVPGSQCPPHSQTCSAAILPPRCANVPVSSSFPDLFCSYPPLIKKNTTCFTRNSFRVPPMITRSRLLRAALLMVYLSIVESIHSLRIFEGCQI